MSRCQNIFGSDKSIDAEKHVVNTNLIYEMSLY